MARAPVAVLGIFVADLAFRAPRLPLMGEKLIVTRLAMVESTTPKSGTGADLATSRSS